MKKPRTDLTQEEILAWADGVAGASASDSAKKLGVHRNTITAWREKVAAFIAEKFDINEYRLPLYGLYPLWINSVIHNLKKNDVTMTVAIGKGLQLLVDKRENLNEDRTSLSDGELAKRTNEKFFGSGSSGDAGDDSEPDPEPED